MKTIIMLALICLPCLAGATPPRLSNPQPSMTMPNYTTTVRPVYLGSSADTPTMRRQKLMRALALREEAASLLREDGGTLTPEHEEYVRRKARAILDGRR